MMDEDAVTGVTSNPTIFQKALSEGDAYDERAEGAARRDGRPDGDLLLARAAGHPRRVRRAAGRLTTRRTASTATSRWRSSPGSPTTPRRRSRRRAGSPNEVDRPNLYVKIPATMPGLPAIEDCTAHGTSINITLIFSLDRYKAVVEAYMRGLERLVAGGGDPSKVVVGRVVLRLARRHRGRQAPRGRRPSGAQGKLAVANAKLAYQHYLEAFSGPRWEYLAGKGANEAALPLGVDVDEEPGLPRRDLRRGADRPGDGEHDAARDDRGVPGSRRGARRHGARRASTKAQRAARRARARRASTTTTSPRRSRRKACRSSPTRSTRSSRASARSAATLAAA